MANQTEPLTKEEQLQKQREYEEKKIKLQYKNRFRREGEERTLALYVYCINMFIVIFFINSIVTLTSVLIYKFWHYIEEYNLNYIDFLAQIMKIELDNLLNILDFNTFNHFLLEAEKLINENLNIYEIITIIILLIIIPLTLTILLKKYISNVVLKERLTYRIQSISNYHITKIKENNNITTIQFKMNKDGKINKEELKRAIYDLCKIFNKWDGVLDSKNITKPIIRLYDESIAKVENFENIEDEKLKRKILLNIGKISNYRIEEINKNDIIFRAKNLSENQDFKELENSIELLCDFLSKGNGKLEHLNNDRYQILFRDKLKSRESKLEADKLKNILKENSLYLGKGGTDVVYTSDTNNDVRGKINGHILTVGMSGSGKSFALSQIFANWINPTSLKEIEKIYIIDFKDSGDYADYTKLDKVVYSNGDVSSALAVSKMVEQEMLKRNIYNNLHKKTDFQKILFIIDEIQTISEKQESRQLERIEKNSWAEISRIMGTLASKSRSANITMWSILQKGTADNLPNGITFRDNIRHRFALKNTNMNLLLDDEVIDKNNIKADKLLQGQFVYADTLDIEKTLTAGFVNVIDYDFTKDLETLNNQLDNKKDIETKKKLDELEDIAVIVERIRREEAVALEESGQSTMIDTVEQLKNYKERNYIAEAIEIYKNGEDNFTEWESFEDEIKEEYTEDIAVIEEIKNDIEDIKLPITDRKIVLNSKDILKENIKRKKMEKEEAVALEESEQNKENKIDIEDIEKWFNNETNIK